MKKSDLIIFFSAAIFSFCVSLIFILPHPIGWYTQSFYLFLWDDEIHHASDFNAFLGFAIAFTVTSSLLEKAKTIPVKIFEESINKTFTEMSAWADDRNSGSISGWVSKATSKVDNSRTNLPKQLARIQGFCGGLSVILLGIAALYPSLVISSRLAYFYMVLIFSPPVLYFISVILITFSFLLIVKFKFNSYKEIVEESI